METLGARFTIPAALLSLLCAATASCVARGLFAPRDAGGAYMVLAVKADRASLAQAVPLAAQVIATRCEYMKARCKVGRQGGEGSNRIRVQVSGVRDLARFKAVLLAQGRLELRAVVSSPNPHPIQTYATREAATKGAGADFDVVPYDEGGSRVFLAVEREPVVAGSDLRGADAVPDHTGEGYKISFTLRPEAAARFGAWTEANKGRYLAVVLNGKAHSAPYIRARIDDSGEIDGNFTKESAEDLALVLRSGALPAPVEVVEEGTYKP